MQEPFDTAIHCTISLDDGNPSSGVFSFTGETHTMGSAVRTAILTNEDVQFCGYTVPHPAETKMSIRIQAREGANIVDIMNKGLDDFSDWCTAAEEAFTNAVA